MGTTSVVPTTGAGAAVAAFLDALGRQDEAAIRATFAPGVWLRALLVRRTVEANSAADAAAVVAAWIGGDGLTVLERAQHAFMGREYLRYRLLLRPSWATDVWHVIEQAGYAKVEQGRITRLDLTCTGYWPVSEPGGEPLDVPGA